LIKPATIKSPQNQITGQIEEVITTVKKTNQAAIEIDKLYAKLSPPTQNYYRTSQYRKITVRNTRN